MSVRMLSIEDSRREQRPHEIQAIRNLWAAVLKQAADDLRDRFKARGSWNWIRGERTHPGSFRWICELLNLGAEQTRKALELRYRNPMARNPAGAGGKRAHATHV